MNSIGLVNFGKSYLESANYLCDAYENNQLALSFGAPIDYLYAHSLELMLKGCLLEENPEVQIESYGHDLLKIYSQLKSMNSIDGLIPKVEKTVRQRWKSHLRAARDSHEAYVLEIAPQGLTGQDLEAFGVFDNQVIGEELPELKTQIKWLSERHRDNGGQFRYLKVGFDQRVEIQQFGLKEDTVRTSCRWACEEVFDLFRKHWTASQAQD